MKAHCNRIATFWKTFLVTHPTATRAGLTVVALIYAAAGCLNLIALVAHQNHIEAVAPPYLADGITMALAIGTLASFGMLAMTFILVEGLKPASEEVIK